MGQFTEIDGGIIVGLVAEVIPPIDEVVLPKEEKKEDAPRKKRVAKKSSESTK